ncbi:MAG: hypothetical protein ACJAV5_001460 [Vicingaceae bacterium]|jgi:hypothetical protein
MALFLSLLLLGSQVGFAVSTHFCGGEISKRAISLVGSTVGCGMENQESSCRMGETSDDTFSEKSCCDNESQVFQLEEDLSKKKNSVELETTFISLFLANYVLLFNSEEKVVYANIPPHPLIQQNSQVLFQTFLL